MPSQGIIAEKKPVERPVEKPWGLDVPEELDLREGVLTEFTIQAHVPAPAVPVLAVADLPVGAEFDAKTGVLKWQPDFSAGNDPTDPLRGMRSYVVKVLLSSSLEPQSAIERTMELKVRDVIRPVEIRWQAPKLEMTEGTAFDTVVEIASLDEPQGPFQFLIAGVPAGVTIAPVLTNPTQFKVHFEPGFDLVGRGGSVSNGVISKTWQGEAIVIGPSGRKTVSAVDWRVIDRRMDPLVSAPDSLQQGDDVRIQVLSQDPNLETTPEVTVARPAFGTLDIENKSDGVTTQTAIRWHGIPESELGKTVTLQVSACVFGSSSWVKNRCARKSIAVTLAEKQVLEPEIDRSSWELGRVQYLREGTSLRIPLSIRNPNGGGSTFSVSIEPASIRSEVRYEAGALILSPRASGFKQFNLKVRLPQGGKRTESFGFEALPRSWSRVLVLGDSLRDAEVLGSVRVFKGAQVVNPLLQELNERMLALREVVVLGTSLLADPDALAAAKPAIEGVATVVVQSPSLGTLGSSFWKRFEAEGMKWQGRIGSVLGASFPGLAALPVRVSQGSGLSLPRGEVRLGGGLTPESANPSLLEQTGGRCQKLLALAYAPVPSLPAYELPIIVRCQIASQRWILSGVEWGDFVMASPEDQSLAQTWAEEVLR
jgi:hypothetical protein